MQFDGNGLLYISNILQTCMYWKYDHDLKNHDVNLVAARSW
jgi:hypothetical protein